MPRALWKGAIRFGLVSIPIELHSAVRDHRPRFRLLHATDKSPVRYERVCQREGEPVAWEDLVKGYEYEKGHFVVLTKEDFKAAAVENDRTIEILDFVKDDEIDDRFFETPYYLTPGKGGERAYALLREAMRASGRVGIAKIVLRDAQHLAAVEVIESAIVLSMTRFADELVDVSTYTFPSAEGVRKAELDMAKMLIDNLAAEWSPEKYTDEYRDNLMRLIKAKLKGTHARLKVETPEREAEVVDLMERLRQSLQGRASRDARGHATPAQRRTERKPRAKKSKTARRAA